MNGLVGFLREAVTKSDDPQSIDWASVCTLACYLMLAVLLLGMMAVGVFNVLNGEIAGPGAGS